MDYNKLNERVRELRNSLDSSFECNHGDKEVSVSGMRISTVTSRSSQWAYNFD